MRQAILMVFMLAILPASALAEPIVFPKEGQSKEQLKKDKSECEDWAEDETNIDPDVISMEIDEVEEEMTEEESKMGGLFGGILKGAATGAVTGAIEKNVGNDVGSDALKGAVLGGVFTHEGQKDDAKDIKYRKEDLKREELKEQQEEFMRAYTVCLEAKGYAVK
jgi:hypothetical protein